jgi:hypothetical protein
MYRPAKLRVSTHQAVAESSKPLRSANRHQKTSSRRYHQFHQMFPAANSTKGAQNCTFPSLFCTRASTNHHTINNIRTLCLKQPGWGSATSDNRTPLAINFRGSGGVCPVRRQLQAQSVRSAALGTPSNPSNAPATSGFYSIAPVLAFRGIDFSLSSIQEDRP